MNRRSSLSIFGPYYYFSSFSTALKYGVWRLNDKSEFEKNKSGSLLRYVVFLKNMHVKMNNKNDPKDKSFTTQQLIKERPKLKDSLKISDRDGNWTNDYESIYCGIHTRLNTELYVLKDLKDQQLLSSHKLNMDIFPARKEDYDETILDDKEKKILA